MHVACFGGESHRPQEGQVGWEQDGRDGKRCRRKKKRGGGLRERGWRVDGHEVGPRGRTWRGGLEGTRREAGETEKWRKEETNNEPPGAGNITDDSV